MTDEIVLAGGVANAGAVVRVGDTVRRPHAVSSTMQRAVLEHLERVGFDRAPRYLGEDEQGRDVFTYVEGDVPTAPFPAWACTDDVLRETVRLLRNFHEAMAGFVPPAERNADLADPDGDDVLCHNDVCPENVVYRSGQPVALLDFELAAPGRRLWDVARMAIMWCPLGERPSGTTWPTAVDVLGRLSVVSRAYGVAADDASLLTELIVEAHAQGRAWVRAKVDAGDPGFVQMWHVHRLAERYSAADVWYEEHRSLINQALASG